MRKLRISIALGLLLVCLQFITIAKAQNVFYVEASSTYLLPSNFNPVPVGGDTIKIRAGRTETLKFKGFEGNENAPIVFINEGGQVIINTTAWGALSFENCKYIKLSGTGDDSVHYGFKLTGLTSGLSFLEYSSDCEAEFVEIEGLPSTFFGIYAKKDFSGNPPIPYPIFKNLCIHDTYIHDLAEGMYIGETVSPGMEFHHMRVYNNIVVNTLRESVQIANSIEDIEIYNNFFLNAGLENLPLQSNGLQIGTNTIANVYNNIILNSPSFGVIILGNGDILVKNNFIQNSAGIFIDNRYALLPYSPIQISDNFFDQIQNDQIIENRNEFTDLFIRNNNYSTNVLFFNNAVESFGLVDIENNQFTGIADLDYSIENGIFLNSSANPLVYQTMGPQIGLTHVFNQTPVLQNIDDILITTNDTLNIPINASVADQDSLLFQSRELPSFIQLIQTASGKCELIINSTTENVGVYEFGILVYDESHQAYDRQIVHLSVMNPDNHPPLLNFNENLIGEAASKFQLDITAYDADNDSLIYTITPLTAFARIINNGESVFLDLQPKISDTGTYQITIIADDAYGSPSTRILNLSIVRPNLTPDRILYRVNFGGPEILAEPLNWEADLENSLCVYGTTYFLRTGSWSWTGINNTTAPNNLFGPFRYDAAGGTEMQFAFPLSAKGRYKVKLFFAERSTEVTANLTGTFNVFIENTQVLDSFNIYQTAQYAALEKSIEVEVEDGILNLNFQQIENNDKINGIEISYSGDLIENKAPEIQKIDPILINENEILNLPVSILDDSFELCNTLTLRSINAPDFLSITQDQEGYSIHLQPNYEDMGLYENTVLIASDGCLTDSLAISISVSNTNQLPVFESIELIELQAGNTLNMTIQASDPDNQMLILELVNAPSFVQFTDTGNGLANLQLNPSTADLGDFSIEVEAIDESGGLSTLFLNGQIYAAPVSGRILLNYNMITDLVKDGSLSTPLYLVDEQNMDPILNQHPHSKNWVPSKKIKDSPYMALIDLGEDYFIDFAFVHDMQYNADLYFSVGLPDYWTEVANFNTSSLKEWNQIKIQAKSRYLLLSMYNTTYAQINELALYGYALNPNKKAGAIESKDLSSRYVIYPNPAKNFIHISNKTNKQTLEILNNTGTVLYRTNENTINIEEFPNGIYLLRLKSDEEVIFQGRFIKTE